MPSASGYGDSWARHESQQHAYAITNPGAQPSQPAAMGRRTSYFSANDDGRPRSSGSSLASSSLRGAMGDMPISGPHSASSGSSGSSSSPRDRSSAAAYNMASGMSQWPQGAAGGEYAEQQALSSGYELPTQQDLTYGGMHSSPNTSPHTQFHHPDYVSYHSSATHPQQQQQQQIPMHASQHAHPTPHIMQSTPQMGYQQQQYQYGYAQSPPRSSSGMATPTTHSAEYTAGRAPISTSPLQTTRPHTHSNTPGDEMRAMRVRIRELEMANEAAQRRIRELESDLANTGPPSSSASAASGTPVQAHSRILGSPGAGQDTDMMSITGLSMGSAGVSGEFAASWKARYEARVKLFCSLNRAGNALCAWHDSRRERRAYPPRMAPPGTLNCGCTFEEALFEESLARHGVGSYHPGESVRMDPALRNPLLALLQERYAYRDGDFERDGETGQWIEGEGHEVWEAKAAAGQAAGRKR
ncbi:hypothetical protein PENSPDRAFT_679955 [Peniophora sp. CONT]|nr:hypothetical protein PENSPDRAFT_679955 [Peniophora sp. CONT]